MIVRPARSEDAEAIREVYEQSFPDEEKELVAELAIELLMEKLEPETISLVAEYEGVHSVLAGNEAKLTRPAVHTSS